MNVTEPIRTSKEIQLFKNYYLEKGEMRNYLLVIVCLYSALRISDILKLRWGDVHDFNTGCFYKHMKITEQKTSKQTKIILNKCILEALKKYFDVSKEITKSDYIFKSRKHEKNPISRVQAYRIIKSAANDLNIDGNIGCHSLRKSFGYHAWKNGIQPALLMELFNHSSFTVTKRYLCINQEDKDNVFRNINY